MENLIEVSNLVKRYKNVDAVDNASFVIERGKIYGLLGPNGAGKTTIMKLLTDIINKTGGNIRCEDTTKIRYLMDVPVFYEFMKVNEFLNMLIDINKIEKKEERLEYLLDICNLKEHENKLIKNLSRGLRQKLGIASVLVGDADVLILDEPVSALDPIGRKEILDIITSLKGKMTVIFSSHILNDIEKICDHVILIHRGKIVLDEECDNLFDAGKYLLVRTNSREEILKLKEIYGVSVLSSNYENTLEIAYDDLTKTEMDILKNAKKQGVEVISMEIKKETLEDIFLKKVKSNG